MTGNPIPAFPSRLGKGSEVGGWIPAFAGMTEVGAGMTEGPIPAFPSRLGKGLEVGG